MAVHANEHGTLLERDILHLPLYSHLNSASLGDMSALSEVLQEIISMDACSACGRIIEKPNTPPQGPLNIKHFNSLKISNKASPVQDTCSPCPAILGMQSHGQSSGNLLSAGRSSRRGHWEGWRGCDGCRAEKYSWPIFKLQTKSHR